MREEQEGTRREERPLTGLENQEMEGLLAPLRELIRCRIFSESAEYTLWFVDVEWHEPSFTEEGSVSLASYDWKTHTARGPLNERFIDWATRHYQFWQPKAHVPLQIRRIDLVKEPRLERRTW